MDDGVPIRRALIGFALIVVFVVVVMALVRPAIFTLAPPRDDSTVAVGTLPEVSAGTERRDVILSRSYGWVGERAAGDGRVQLGIIVGPTPTGIAAVNAASPVEPDCAVEIAADRLMDCAGRSWTFAGHPIDEGIPPLERFPIQSDGGTVFVDFTRTIED